MKLKLFYFVLIIVLLTYYQFAPEIMDKEIMSLLLVVVFVSLLLFFSRGETNGSLKGQYLKHSTLAILGIVIVFFQYPVDYVVGNFDNSNMVIWVNHKIVVKSLTLSIIGLICFLLGYISYNKKASAKVRNERPVRIDILLILATISLVLYFMTVDRLYLIGHYKIGVGPQAYYAVAFFQALVFASIIQKCRNIIILKIKPNSFKEYLSILGWPLLILNGLYLTSVLISGDRGPLMVYGIIFVSGYFFVTRKKMSLRHTIIFIMLGAFSITLLGVARSMDSNLGFFEKLEAGLNEENVNNSISPQTYELSRSIRTLHVAVNHVPNERDFFYGKFQLQQLLATIPFSGIFDPFLYNNDKEIYGTSAKFITWARQGIFPKSGDGTSCIADFYLDFGQIGVILGMFWFGYLMRYAEITMYLGVLPSLFAHIFFMVYLATALYIARGAVFEPLADCSKILIFLLFNRYFSRTAYN